LACGRDVFRMRRIGGSVQRRFVAVRAGGSGILGSARTICEFQYRRAYGYDEERVLSGLGNERTAMRDLSPSERCMDRYAVTYPSPFRGDARYRSHLSNERWFGLFHAGCVNGAEEAP